MRAFSMSCLSTSTKSGLSGQADAKAGCGLDDADDDLDEALLRSDELGSAQSRALGDRPADGPREPVGCGVQDEPDLVCLGAGAGVRSLIGRVLWSSMRFAAWPRAQELNSQNRSGVERFGVVTTARMSCPRAVAMRAMTRRAYDFQLAAA